MTHYFCSTFSREYAYKGLLLYHSLLSCDTDFHFFMVCLHDEVKELFKQMNLEKATIISLSQVERKDAQLAEIKKIRSDKEYIWSSKASVMLYILEYYPHADHIVWLDGDTFFYSSPNPIFTEWGESSILLTEERWRSTEAHKANHFGRYNTGFMGFKHDREAIRCLHWFRNRLLEWCYDKHENSLWSDQLYVNDWLKRFSNVGVIKNKGINVTPYFIKGCTVTKKGHDVYVNGDRLVLFHLYGFKYFDGNEFDLCSYKMTLSDEVIKWIYMPYLQACNDMMKLCKIDHNFYKAAKPKDQFIRNYFNLDVNKVQEMTPNICTVLTKNYLAQGLSLYDSLRRHTPRFRLWVLCVDDTTYSLLEKLNLDYVALISLKNVANKKLTKIQSERQLHEFCWTLKSSLLSYLMRNNYTIDSILYMDADLFFYQDIRKIYNDWGNNSLYITKLWLGPKSEKKAGKYSAGLIGIKRDKGGISTLQSWQRKCLKWCFDRRENGLWADQKYLDEWPRRISGVKISDNLGVNAGPWNIKRKNSVHMEGDTIYFANQELVCYHFSGFRIISENEYELCNRKKLPEKAKCIYSVYIDNIKNSIAKLKLIDNNLIQSITGQDRATLYNYHFTSI